MDLDTEGKFSYCGCEVSSPDGKLVMLFREGNLGTNIDYALAVDTLVQALNAASAPSLPMSFVARASIREAYDPEIAKTRAKIDGALGRETALEPNFEANFAKLTAAGITDWQHNLGYFLFNVASSQTESEVRCRCATGEGERTDRTERVWGVGPRPFRRRFYCILM